MEQYKKWLEEQIEKCLNDKDLQREHWAYCTAYRKLIEALPIHGVMQAEALAFHECIDKWLELDNYQDFADWLYKRVQGASVADGAVGKTVSDGCKHESFTSRNKNGFICDECGKKMKDCAQH